MTFLNSSPSQTLPRPVIPPPAPRPLHAHAHMAEIAARLAGHPIFADVPGTSLSPLIAHGAFRRLDGARSLCCERETAQNWFLLLEGEMESVRHGLDGEERIFCRFAPGDLVAEVLMFVPSGVYPISIRTRMPCKIFQMRRQDLHQLCEREPRVALRLLECASARLCRRLDEVELMARTSAAQRLAGYLLKLLEQGGKGQTAIEFPVSQRQLAATLGIRAETLNRLLADWLRQGVVRGKCRAWEIVAPQALADIAQRT